MKLNRKFLKHFTLTLSFGMFLLPISNDASAQMGFWGGNTGCTGINNETVLTSIVANLPNQEISNEEEAALKQMVEQQKLARDVFQVLFQIWGHDIFKNIGNSEQHHMAAVVGLLDKYNVTLPVSFEEEGLFADSNLQDLYDTLVGAGNVSFDEALRVGAEIEELAVRDLTDLLTQTDNIDMQTVFQNLLRGARNHLRAFSAQISTDDTYVTHYLTEEEYQQIMTTPIEAGLADQDGEVVYGHGEWLNFVDTDGDGLCDMVQEVEKFTSKDLDKAYANGKMFKERQQLKKIKSLQKLNKKYKKMLRNLNRKIRKLQIKRNKLK